MGASLPPYKIPNFSTQAAFSAAQIPGVTAIGQSGSELLLSPEGVTTLPIFGVIGANPSVAVVYPNPLASNADINSAFTPSPNTAGAVPTIIASGQHHYCILPAAVGDVIELDVCMTVDTAAGSGLILSAWSIGGATARDWSSGALGLQSVPGCITYAAATDNHYPQSNIKIVNTVKLTDIDANGMATFVLAGANTVTNAATHTIYCVGGAMSVFVAKNLKGNQPGVTNLPNKITVYPGGTKGGNIASATNGAGYPTSGTGWLPLDTSGQFDLLVKANVGDFIEIDTQLTITATNPKGIMWASIGGSQVCAWSQPATIAANWAASGFYYLRGDLYLSNNVPGNNKCIRRVVLGDLNGNGQVQLRAYCQNVGTSDTSFTVQGLNGSALSYATATVWPGERKYIGANTGGTGVQYPAEGSPWIDSAGLFNILCDSGPAGIQWYTATTPGGPWTLQVGTTGVLGFSGSQNGVWYENGTLYIYLPYSTGVNVWVGTTPANVVQQSTPALSPSQISPMADQVYNSCVTKGPGGMYYMGWEGKPTKGYVASGASQTNPLAGTYGVGAYTNWCLGMATSISPLGPFVYTPGTFPMVNLCAAGTNPATWSNAGGPFMEYNGEYLSMYYHSGTQLSGNNPNSTFAAISYDGVSFTPTGVNALGKLTPLMQPSFCLGNQTGGDPSFFRVNGLSYLISSDYQTSPIYGGFTISDPTRWPIQIGNISK